MADRTIGWLAKNGLSRYRPGAIVIEIGLFVIGVLFWIDATMGATSFTPLVWGDLAYSIPAICWAFVNMGCAALTIAGLIRPVRNWMVIVGAVLSIAQYLVLAWSAMFDGGTAIIAMFAFVLLIPFHIWLLFEAANYGSD